MNKIKYCHLIDASTFNPLLFNSIKYSDRSKFDYTVITLDPAGKLQEQAQALGISSFSLNYTSKRKIFSTVWRLYRFFRKEKISIVQVHGFTASPIGLLAAKLARVPVRIFSGHHSHEIPLYNRRLLTLADSFCGRFLAKYAIAPSEDMKKTFMTHQRIPERKIVVVHHGFDLDDWRLSATGVAGIRKELGIENKIVFGAVGRLFWVKDFETLIQAFAVVAGQRNDTVLLIVGDGEQRNLLQDLVNSLELKGQVIFTGKRTDIAAVINAFDVFVHTALAESFGMVFIEAMALGKPVITTGTGVAPEIIEEGNNGFIVDKKKPAMLAEAMMKMLARREDWKQMADMNIRISDGFAVQKTQAVVDEYCIQWLQKKK